jgi:hypothetical protein
MPLVEAYERARYGVVVGTVVCGSVVCGNVVCGTVVSGVGVCNSQVKPSVS